MSFVLPWRLRGRSLSVPLVAGLTVGLLTFVLYLYTLAPNVTLEDSGEYITAAATLGVTHPPGYPLWTTISHLFVVLLPFGNVAWKVNLVSAVFGGIANGLVAALVAHSTRWLLDAREENDVHAGLPGWLLPLVAGVAAGLSLGCSDVMWSQSVIVEVYTLNVTFLLATLWLLYLWVREPERIRWLLASGFVYAFGLTNHNSLLFISPIFPLLVWLVRRDFFPTFMAAVFLFSLSAGAVLVWFSDDPVLEMIIQRLAFVLFAVVGGLALWKRAGRWRGFAVGFLAGAALCLAASWLVGGWFRIEGAAGWEVAAGAALVGGLVGQSALDRRFIVAFLVLGWIGLMPYGLESFYSSTNPPMNWSYSRAKAGFFYAVSRGQYTNNLSGLLEKTFGPPMGVFRAPAPGPDGNPAPEPPAVPASEKAFRLAESSWDAVYHYADYLQSNFSLPLCLIAFLSIFLFAHLPRERRNWLLFLLAAFVMLSFFLTLIDPPEAMDRSTHLIRRRFYLQAHCVFALALGYGVAGGLLALRRNAREVPLWAYALAPLLAAFPFALNYATSEQRGHWFGWMYGADMLRPLDRNAIVFGGTDPGRFVPTYMIFCESRQDPRWKRDPSFDRSDLYILTQNALGDYFYKRYLDDQYDVARRITKYNRFEKWLGRDTAYPAGGIVLPTEKEFSDAFRTMAGPADSPNGPSALSGLDAVFRLNGEIARMIFEKNKAAHSFYLEESFPIPWMYPYLTPSGLILKINPEPLAALPAEAVRADRAFWDAYAAKLLADPRFLRDVTARSAFGKLRLSIAGLYAYRRLDDEALYAFRQSLALSPHNPETVIRMASFLLSIDRADDAVPEVDAAMEYDPENKQLQQMAFQLQLWKQLQEQVKGLGAAVAANPGDLDSSRKLVKALFLLKRPDDAVAALEKRREPVPQDELTACLQVLQSQAATAAGARLLDGQLRRRPGDPVLLYQRASFYALDHRPADAFRLLAKAITAGGEPFRAAPASDASWEPYRNDPAFQALVAPKGEKK